MKRPLASPTVQSNGGTWNGKFYASNRPRLRNNNTYKDEEKAAAIVVCAVIGSQNKAEDALNIPQQTLSDWVNGRHINERVRTMAKHFAEEISKGFEEILTLGMQQTIDALKGGKMSDKDRNWLVVFGADKWLVLNNMANQIVSSVDISDDEKRAKLIELQTKLKGVDGA